MAGIEQNLTQYASPHRDRRNIYHLKLDRALGIAMAIVLFLMCAAAFFLLGAKPELRRYIEDRVGPSVARRGGRPIPIDPEELTGAK